MKEIKTYLRDNIKELIFGIYFLFTLTADCISSVSGYNIWDDGFFITLVIIALLTLVSRIKKWINWSRQHFFLLHNQTSKKQELQVFAIASGITLAVLIFWFAGSYPGSFSPDSIDQYRQAVTGNYNDWHPAWQTLLSFTLPLKLTGSPASIILFQIVWFSLFMGYFALTVYLYSGILYAYVASALILFSPFTLEIVMFPWKDTSFAVACGFCMLYALHIYFTKGEWCNKTWRILLFAFMLTNATLLRHNGVLFTFFLLVALIFFIPRKKWYLLAATTLLMLVLIRIPFYSTLDVSKPGNRVVEISGLPLSIITYIAKVSPDKLDDETMQFVDKMMKLQPDWRDYHNLSGFNSVKFRGIDRKPIEQAGILGIFKMTLRCFIASPGYTLKAVIGLTIPVYGLEIISRVYQGVAENDFGIVYTGNQMINYLEDLYCRLVTHTPLRFLFLSIGMTILVMFAFILFRTDFKSAADWKRLALCLPVFVYDFGTMLLLSGPDVRFFYVNLIISPLVVLIMGRNSETNS